MTGLAPPNSGCHCPHCTSAGSSVLHENFETCHISIFLKFGRCDCESEIADPAFLPPHPTRCTDRPALVSVCRVRNRLGNRGADNGTPPAAPSPYSNLQFEIFVAKMSARHESSHIEDHRAAGTHDLVFRYVSLHCAIANLADDLQCARQIALHQGTHGVKLNPQWGKSFSSRKPAAPSIEAATPAAISPRDSLRVSITNFS